MADVWRFAIRRAIADPFREHCDEIGISPRRKLEILVVRWIARGTPLKDLHIVADPYSDENRSRFTIRESFAVPLVDFARDHGVTYLELIEGIILGYLLRIGTEPNHEIAEGATSIQTALFFDVGDSIGRLVGLASYSSGQP